MKIREEAEKIIIEYNLLSLLEDLKREISYLLESAFYDEDLGLFLDYDGIISDIKAIAENFVSLSYLLDLDLNTERGKDIFYYIKTSINDILIKLDDEFMEDGEIIDFAYSELRGESETLDALQKIYNDLYDFYSDLETIQDSLEDRRNNDYDYFYDVIRPNENGKEKPIPENQKKFPYLYKKLGDSEKADKILLYLFEASNYDWLSFYERTNRFKIIGDNKNVVSEMIYQIFHKLEIKGNPWEIFKGMFLDENGVYETKNLRMARNSTKRGDTKEIKEMHAVLENNF